MFSDEKQLSLSFFKKKKRKPLDLLDELKFHIRLFKIRHSNCRFERTKRVIANLESTFFYMGMLIDTKAIRPVLYVNT